MVRLAKLCEKGPTLLVAMPGGGKTRRVIQFAKAHAANRAPIVVHLYPHDLVSSATTTLSDAVNDIAGKTRAIFDQFTEEWRQSAGQQQVAVYHASKPVMQQDTPENPCRLVVFDGIDGLSEELNSGVYKWLTFLNKQGVWVLFTSRSALHNWPRAYPSLNTYEDTGREPGEHFYDLDEDEVKTLMKDCGCDYLNELAGKLKEETRDYPLALDLMVQVLKRSSWPERDLQGDEEQQDKPAILEPQELEDYFDRDAEGKLDAQALLHMRMIPPPHLLKLKSPRFQSYRNLQRDLEKRNYLLPPLVVDQPYRIHSQLRRDQTSNAKTHDVIANSLQELLRAKYDDGVVHDPSDQYYWLIEWLYHQIKGNGDLSQFNSMLSKMRVNLWDILAFQIHTDRELIEKAPNFPTLEGILQRQLSVSRIDIPPQLWEDLRDKLIDEIVTRVKTAKGFPEWPGSMGDAFLRSLLRALFRFEKNSSPHQFNAVTLRSILVPVYRTISGTTDTPPPDASLKWCQFLESVELIKKLQERERSGSSAARQSSGWTTTYQLPNCIQTIAQRSSERLLQRSLGASIVGSVR
jgi:hypothetical protein